ncbi:hypothetical protein F0L74_22025 [Chitinophaga agrisoli]|uniref:Uncharacterized protein n=1 Tax=Chitinophaga agrisoli TaxID=2607653 RepID=A0A5B2VIX7_9BACT|nr:hypothetical protein [Chitinophaga agrisoli]KAA2238895.1 hypothetical protein F0L74_22025 [Chitinophaga agrisoli]
MAKQSGIIKFTGKLGDFTGYRRNKDHIIRRRPEYVHQTAATRQAAHAFGIISRKGKLIRQAIVPLLDTRSDGTLVNRLNRAMILAAKEPPVSPSYTPANDRFAGHATADQLSQRLSQTLPNPEHHQLQSLKGFRFNPHTGLEGILNQPATYTPEGILQIPAQLVRMPQKATHMEVHAIAVRINFAERCITGIDESLEVIQLDTSCKGQDQPFNGLDLPLSVPGKGTLFVVLQLRACTSCNGEVYPFHDRRYMAADIVTVIPPVVPVQKPVGKKGKGKRPAYGQAQKRYIMPHTLAGFANANAYSKLSPSFPQLE